MSNTATVPNQSPPTILPPRPPRPSSTPCGNSMVNRALAPKPIRYLGLIGSRAKVVRLSDALVTEGIPADQVRRVHSPVGLDLGAITPQEIAVSILAEMIGVRYGKIDASSTQTDKRPARSLRWAPSEPQATVTG